MQFPCRAFSTYCLSDKISKSSIELFQYQSASSRMTMSLWHLLKTAKGNEKIKYRRCLIVWRLLQHQLHITCLQFAEFWQSKIRPDVAKNKHDLTLPRTHTAIEYFCWQWENEGHSTGKLLDGSHYQLLQPEQKALLNSQVNVPWVESHWIRS